MKHTHDSTMPQQTILLVDDEEFLRRMLARVLGEAGFEVIEAENGESALEAAQQMNGTISLVVTDVHMPVMDGIEFARELRPLDPRLPVLFISGRDPDGADDPGFLDGHLLRKPFRSEAFLDAVTRLLDRPEELGTGDNSVA